MEKFPTLTCIRCAALVGSDANCTECKFEIFYPDETLLSLASEIAQHRFPFKISPPIPLRPQRLKHEHATQYCLTEAAVGNVIVWLTLAAIGGIVGNASSDAVKAAVKKIIRITLDRDLLKTPTEKNLQNLSDIQIEQFIRNVEFSLDEKRIEYENMAKCLRSTGGARTTYRQRHAALREFPDIYYEYRKLEEEQRLKRTSVIDRSDKKILATDNGGISSPSENQPSLRDLGTLAVEKKLEKQQSVFDLDFSSWWNKVDSESLE